MSRTYRRASGKEPIWVTHEWTNIPGFKTSVRVKREGKDLLKSMAKYHGDHGYSSYVYACPTKWYRNSEYRKLRSQHKQELIRYYRDFDYEVQFNKKTRAWSWW